jgi:ABC-type transport system involved in cytochrome c biogenesis ATPase subunit
VAACVFSFGVGKGGGIEPKLNARENLKFFPSFSASTGHELMLH